MEQEIIFNINSCYNNPVFNISNESPQEFSLFNNQEENDINDGCCAREICEICVNNFQRCDICEGYFENHFFYNDHELKCSQIFQIYREKENLIKCLNCKILVSIDHFESHKEECEAQIKDTQMLCSFCNIKISISLIEDHEKACKIIFDAMLINVDTIDCEYCKEKFPLNLILSHEGMCKKLKERQKEIEDQIKLIKVEYPKEWEVEIKNTAIINDNLTMVSLDEHGSQYKLAQELFKLTLPGVSICNIFRIHNKHLWEKYSKEKARIINEKGSADEKWLFHGTKSNNPKCVYQLGFDISFASDQGSFGRGVYFARQSVYSYSGYSYIYEGKGYMFLAKVITGKTFSPNMANISQKHRNIGSNRNVSIFGQAVGQGMKKPPFLEEKKYIYYDSVSNVSNPNDDHISQMYIVYENDKAYPYYLIEFDASNQNIPANKVLVGNLFPVARQPNASIKKSNLSSNPLMSNLNNFGHSNISNNNLFNNQVNQPNVFSLNSNINSNQNNIFQVHSYSQNPFVNTSSNLNSNIIVNNSNISDKSSESNIKSRLRSKKKK